MLGELFNLQAVGLNHLVLLFNECVNLLDFLALDLQLVLQVLHVAAQLTLGLLGLELFVLSFGQLLRELVDLKLQVYYFFALLHVLVTQLLQLLLVDLHLDRFTAVYLAQRLTPALQLSTLLLLPVQQHHILLQLLQVLLQLDDFPVLVHELLLPGVYFGLLLLKYPFVPGHALFHFQVELIELRLQARYFEMLISQPRRLAVYGVLQLLNLGQSALVAEHQLLLGLVALQQQVVELVVLFQDDLELLFELIDNLHILLDVLAVGAALSDNLVQLLVLVDHQLQLLLQLSDRLLVVFCQEPLLYDNLVQLLVLLQHVVYLLLRLLKCVLVLGKLLLVDLALNGHLIVRLL